MKCHSSAFPHIDIDSFLHFVLKNYVPFTLRYKKKDTFLSFGWGSMSMVAYKSKFHPLSSIFIQCFDTKKEKIHHFVKGLNTNL